MKGGPWERVGRVLAEAMAVDLPVVGGWRKSTLAEDTRYHDAIQQTRQLKRAFDIVGDFDVSSERADGIT